MLFSALGCSDTSEKNDLLDFVLRTMPVCVMADSGEEACGKDISGRALKNRKMNAATSLQDSLRVFKESRQQHSESAA